MMSIQLETIRIVRAFIVQTPRKTSPMLAE